MDAKAFTPTEEQLHGLELALKTSNNIQFRALAGCGKTEMLVMIQRAIGEVLGIAFNTDIKKVMDEKFNYYGTVRTFNSLGLEAWNKIQNIRSVIERDKDGRVTKTKNLFSQAIDGLDKRTRREAWEIYSDVTTAVGLAKSTGYVPRRWLHRSKGLVGEDEFYRSIDIKASSLLIDLVEGILAASITAAYRGNIDFDDQCYMPVLFGGAWPDPPNVLGDEAQDFNPVNIEMLAQLKTSRLITVGDNWQSIYAFRGAVVGGMDIQRERFKATVADLSVCFRCPQAIVENARWRAPNMKWIKPGGIVAVLKNPSSTTFPDGCAVVCRNNAPLFKLALHLLSNGRSVRVGGSDIGPRIIAIMKKLGTPEMNRETTIGKIAEWREERLALGSTTCNDTADCMLVFANAGRTLGDAIAYAGDILRRKGTITLLTGHKAKGLEWDVVYHLDPRLIREQEEQDLNLRYVIQTRSKNCYYEIASEEIRP